MTPMLQMSTLWSYMRDLISGAMYGMLPAVHAAEALVAFVHMASAGALRFHIQEAPIFNLSGNTSGLERVANLGNSTRKFHQRCEHSSHNTVTQHGLLVQLDAPLGELPDGSKT